MPQGSSLGVASFQFLAVSFFPPPWILTWFFSPVRQTLLNRQRCRKGNIHWIVPNTKPGPNWRMWRTRSLPKQRVTCTCMESENSWRHRLTKRDVQKSALPHPWLQATFYWKSIVCLSILKQSSCAALPLAARRNGEKLILRLVQSRFICAKHD